MNLLSWSSFILLWIILNIITITLLKHRYIYSIILWCIFAILISITLKIFAKEIHYDHSIDFITSYALELILSIDNIFVFIIIFEKFKISLKAQYKILRIGIISAILMRLIMILFAVELIYRFIWIFYGFGFILITSAIHMFLTTVSKYQYNHELKYQTKSYHKYFCDTDTSAFYKKIDGKLIFTVNLLALICIEYADILFAFDSIPAVISITKDYFIIFTSNVLAISSLREIFFLLSNSIQKYYYLKHGVVVILFGIGVKLILIPLKIHIPSEYFLIFITFIISACIYISKRKIVNS